ncbi:hypothetical protein MJO52_06490 [Microbulbifer variabilis]|uniref:Uncharacterized protein n=1 Tax=Microbulbifer variabilis TaxID=266805 RepID=A0ABY4VEQ8_9GAMM|nr:hypothetical protein [Microbulbifer variabilis]USD22781.1 hypothetical protein MJO52_06490 [Microbulbifer variabilis]
MNIWELYNENEKLADLRQTDLDQPWFIGELIPTPAFDRYRNLFERAQRFIETEEFDSEESEDTFIEVDNLKLLLVRLSDKREFTGIMLSVTGNEAWWRI